MKAFSTMFKTELKLSLRGMDMFIFAICMPVVVMVILGVIYGNKSAFEGAEYTFLAQSFGAVATIAICAGGVMGLPLVVSDYRYKKILKRFKVTPTSPALILAVQVALYALYSVASLILVYTTATLFFGYQLSGSGLHFLGAYLYEYINSHILIIDLIPGDNKSAYGVNTLYRRHHKKWQGMPQKNSSAVIGAANRRIKNDAFLSFGEWTTYDSKGQKYKSAYRGV